MSLWPPASSFASTSDVSLRNATAPDLLENQCSASSQSSYTSQGFFMGDLPSQGSVQIPPGKADFFVYPITSSKVSVEPVEESLLGIGQGYESVMDLPVPLLEKGHATGIGPVSACPPRLLIVGLQTPR